MTHSIYCLKDPRDGSPFYVGATKSKLPVRLSEHVNEGCGNSGVMKSKKERILNIINSGNYPIIELLKKVTIEKVNYYESKYAWKFQNQGYEMIQKDRFIYHKEIKVEMKSEKRKVRGYKIADKPYTKAMKRAKKEKIPLATLIEDVVNGYADGMEEYLFSLKTK